MKGIILLPHPFQRIGWIVFLPTVLLGLLMAIDLSLIHI